MINKSISFYVDFLIQFKLFQKNAKKKKKREREKERKPYIFALFIFLAKS